MSLTDIKIRALEHLDKLYRVTDSNGLCLEVPSTGKMRWRYRYVHEDKAKMISLGRYPDVSLKESRIARNEAAALLRQGVDPFQVLGTPLYRNKLLHISHDYSGWIQNTRSRSLRDKNEAEKFIYLLYSGNYNVYLH